jgi:hypothetical protein
MNDYRSVLEKEEQAIFMKNTALSFLMWLDVVLFPLFAWLLGTHLNWTTKTIWIVGGAALMFALVAAIAVSKKMRGHS